MSRPAGACAWGLTAKDRVFPAALARWQLEHAAVAVTRMAGAALDLHASERRGRTCLSDPRPAGGDLSRVGLTGGLPVR
jgi:hypothetical protein